jgi:trehalose 6-phosphate synthase
MFDSVSQEELVALYAASDACVVSSTRDGLNVVSLEYIACQQRGQGVLLLSEFAGSAEYLVGAVKFNPWNTSEFADAIYDALNMDHNEKAKRFERLHEYTIKNTRYESLYLDRHMDC